MHRFILIAAALLIVAFVSRSGCDLFEEPYRTLHALCDSGDATPTSVQAFLDLRVDVNATDQKRTTPLYHAAMNENLEGLTLLIKAGADVDAKNNERSTPLDTTIRENNPKNAEVLRASGGKFGKDLP